MHGKHRSLTPSRDEAAHSADERRNGCRYTVVQDRAWLGWWQNETFRSTSARVIDISIRGCRMIVDELPPAGQLVWFCPPGSSCAEWIEAKQVESRKRLFGPRQVRIIFRHAFSYETFKDVVYGNKPAHLAQPSNLWSPDSQGHEGW